MSATEAERAAAGERIAEMAYGELLGVFRALVERFHAGVELWAEITMRASGAGPLVIVRSRDGFGGADLAWMLELAGQNLDVELEGDGLVYSCPSWPTRKLGDGR